jgi:uncharacterized protein YqgV (UPF0045/DUF77 family)
MLVAFSVSPSGTGFEYVHDAVAAVSADGPRVSLVLKADIFGERTGELTGKLERLEAAREQFEV